MNNMKSRKCAYSISIALVLVFLVLFLLTRNSSASAPINTWFPISSGIEHEVSPKVAYNSQDQEYLVLMYFDRPGCDDIRAERVSKTGVLLGGKWIAAGCPAERRYPDVAYNDQQNQYLIVWLEELGGYTYVRSQRYSADLTPQTEGVQTLYVGVPGLLMPGSPAVDYAHTADKYLVVWHIEYVPPPPGTNATSIAGYVVLNDGTPDSAGSFTISQDPTGEPRKYPKLAYNVARNEYLVVWQQLVGSDDDIYARRVTGHGELLMPESFIISANMSFQDTPAVAALPNVGTGGQYLVVWEEWETDSHIYARRVNGDGSVDGYQFYVMPSESNIDPVVAGSVSSKRYLVAATRLELAPFYTNYLREVSPEGTLIGDEFYAGGPCSYYPDLAAGPKGDFFLVFQHQVSTNFDVYGLLWGNRIYLPLVMKN
jgi:hypothetical protein